MEPFTSIAWHNGVVEMLDQRRLPQETVYLEFTTAAEIAQAIQDMVIRGAPAIGVAAAYGLALNAVHSQAESTPELLQELRQAADRLRSARPTAVNLSYAVERILETAAAFPQAACPELADLILAEAGEIEAEDARTNRAIGANALALLPEKSPLVFIHHCNTGALATAAYGTALGIIRAAHDSGRPVFVYVDETRPRLQGARLTSWELLQLGIPHAVIVDGAASHMMRTKGVDLAVVGCDRVAANGDTANKIGTYHLALAARAHNVPFYVAAPTSTIDLSVADGAGIPIEERPAAEVARIGGEEILPSGAAALNPAFDVTPAEWITAIITEEGAAFPPFSASLADAVSRAEIRRKAAWAARLPP